MKSDLFSSAELAQAAYSDLVSGSTNGQITDLTDKNIIRKQSETDHSLYHHRENRALPISTSLYQLDRYCSGQVNLATI
ncbi:hypothetical protein A9Q88_06065 [Gammaproteobacteria bacterium 50_400_T64]|nr:hypothetical protein A9Q88_06065 [Gammaproteobacteria bacterium 50_400_T64]